ncbi:hypothetical protein C8R45DRAFT_1219773 [Mycena sanguinolenta]|nr:hypothetical protein C8R45DRAFT_1219773 [Mycena sanguinolenta]
MMSESSDLFLGSPKLHSTPKKAVRCCRTCQLPMSGHPRNGRYLAHHSVDEISTEGDETLDDVDTTLTDADALMDHVAEACGRYLDAHHFHYYASMQEMMLRAIVDRKDNAANASHLTFYAGIVTGIACSAMGILLLRAK